MKSADHRAAAESLSDFRIFSTIFYYFKLYLIERMRKDNFN